MRILHPGCPYRGAPCASPGSRDPSSAFPLSYLLFFPSFLCLSFSSFPLSLVFPSLLSLFPLCPLCSSLCELCVSVPLLFFSSLRVSASSASLRYLFSSCSSSFFFCVLRVLCGERFISYSPSKISPALIFPVAKCAINSRFAARKSYCPSSRGSTHSTRSNATGAISFSATPAAKK